jgi:hypothetical protein
MDPGILAKNLVKSSRPRSLASPGKRARTAKPRRSKAFLAELRRQCRLANDADAARELAALREVDRGDDWADYAAWPTR